MLSASVPVEVEGLDPLVLLGLPAAWGGPRFFWSAADGSEVGSAFGAARIVTASGPDRMGRAARDCAEATRALGGADVAGAGHGVGSARWLGGFAFGDTVEPSGPWSEFGALRFTLPAATLVVDGSGARLTMISDHDDAGALRAAGRELVAALAGVPGRPTAAPAGAGPVHVDERPHPDARRARLDRAVEAVGRGDVEKVVVAVSRAIRAPAPFDPLAVLARLRATQPGCFHFLVEPRPGLAFVGATPERLVRVTGSRLATMALAGSARRDPDPAVDRALGEALLASTKDRAEHALVVDAVRGALAAADLSVPDRPLLRRLATIQHLETLIEARLGGRGDVLEAAAALHPTPALGGVPRDAALRLIATLEGAERGWYGGGVGWLDGQGDGDLAVAIRSVLLAGRTATAFAGAGVVAGSDPDAEAREIELKLGATLSALSAP